LASYKDNDPTESLHVFKLLHALVCWHRIKTTIQQSHYMCSSRYNVLSQGSLTLKSESCATEIPTYVFCCLRVWAATCAHILASYKDNDPAESLHVFKPLHALIYWHRIKTTIQQSHYMCSSRSCVRHSRGVSSVRSPPSCPRSQAELLTPARRVH